MRKNLKAKVKIKKPPILFDQTQKVIKSIKGKLDGDFVAYWVSHNSSISDEDVIPFYEIIKKDKKSDTLYIYIKSDGGSGEGALRIVNLFRKFYKTIVALVPTDCASAATMLVLGANEIQMGPLAYLSAIDTSLTHDLSPIDKLNELVSVSQNELSRVIDLWNGQKQKTDINPYGNLYSYIHPLVFGAVDRATSLSIRITTEILSYHMEDMEKAEKISKYLNSEYPSHSYPITFREAEKIGLNVVDLDTEINDALLELSGLYSEMAQLAYTDYDELNYHDNEILKVIEGQKEQFYYQKDKDWHYRKEERRWVAMNDNSSWRKNEWVKKKIVTSKFYIM